MSQSPTSAAGGPTAAAYAKAWERIGDRVMSGRSWSGRERHCLFLNTRDGRFADVSHTAGVDLPEDGRGLALVDWDHDGDLDAWIAARSAPRLRLLRNRSTVRSVSLRLRGVTANRDGIGARVTVRLRGGRPITVALRAGEGFLSQSSKTLVVGVGAAEVADVRVRWPGGRAETFSGVQVGGRYLLRQGARSAVRLATRAPVSLAPKPLKIARKHGASVTFLARPVPFPPIQYGSPGGEVLTLETDPNMDNSAQLRGESFSKRAEPVCGGKAQLAGLGRARRAPKNEKETGPNARRTCSHLVQSLTLRPHPQQPHRATLLVLWSRWCAPCLKELHALSAAAANLTQQHVDVLALNVDRLSTTQVADPAQTSDTALRAALAGAGVTTPLHTIDDRNLAQIEMLNRWLFTWREAMPLPMSFLLDSHLNLRAIMRGPLDLARLRRDVAMTHATPVEQIAYAALGPGTFYGSVVPARYFELARFFLEHGHEAAALAYFRAETRQDPTAAAAFNMAGALLAKGGKLAAAQHQFEQAIAVDPKHVEALTNLARVAMAGGQMPKALGYLSRAVAAQPNNAMIRHSFGLALLRAGRPLEAKQQLLKARSLDPKAPVAEPLAAIARALAPTPNH